MIAILLVPRGVHGVREDWESGLLDSRELTGAAREPWRLPVAPETVRPRPKCGGFPPKIGRNLANDVRWSKLI